jgi:hypothetical protein
VFLMAARRLDLDLGISATGKLELKAGMTYASFVLARSVLPNELWLIRIASLDYAERDFYIFCIFFLL